MGMGMRRRTFIAGLAGAAARPLAARAQQKGRSASKLPPTLLARADDVIE
jgi:hypothetical protein